MRRTQVSQQMMEQISQARLAVASRLHAAFKTRAMIDAIGEERATLLQEHTNGTGAFLLWVSAQTREAIVERRPESRLRPLALWSVIDAIGNVADCEPGRWPYLTDEGRARHLAWALDELADLEEAIASAQAVPASDSHLSAEAMA